MAVKVARIIGDDEKSQRDPREVLFQTYPPIFFLLLIFGENGGGRRSRMHFEAQRGPRSEALGVKLSVRATLSATSCWQPLKKTLGRRSAAVLEARCTDGP